MRRVWLISIILTLLLTQFGCKEGSNSGKDDKAGKQFRIAIVMDTVDDWSSGIRDGFQETLDSELGKIEGSAHYTIYDTELKPEKAEEILAALKESKPDLICTINYPTVFADQMISKKLSGPEYKIVSENCMPVLSETIASWDRPGGNITGVGVFVQMNSPMRLMKQINPKATNLVFYTWDAVGILNDYFEKELRRAAHEEGINIVEFKRVKHFEETIELLSKYRNKKNYFFMGGISAFVHKDGTPADDKEEVDWSKKNLQSPFISYEETTVEYGNLAGACVIWYDIGAQLAEKGARILHGENPGDMAWDYPRKFNIILNQKRAKKLGVVFPETLRSAAYRIYTDYEGNFIGHAK